MISATDGVWTRPQVRDSFAVAAERVIVNVFVEMVVDGLPKNRDHRGIKSAYHEVCLPLVVVCVSALAIKRETRQRLVDGHLPIRAAP